MTGIITYSLRGPASNSDDYYQTIADFAKRWLAETLKNANARRAITGFGDYRQLRGDSDRSEAEYAFELLALGVLLREHGREAAYLSRWLGRLLSWLVTAQKRWLAWESLIKRGRGWLSGLNRPQAAGTAAREDVGALVDWLQAHGESAQARRLAQWQDYFEHIGEQLARATILAALTLAVDFAFESDSVLGGYTAGVEAFLREAAPRYRGRYDAGFVSRSRLEYHLGMLGTEILSRAYRSRFLAAKRKIVIVPPCLRAKPDGECKGIETPLGLQCQACEPACRVHQVTKLGEKRGFEVYVIPDELRVFGAGAAGGPGGLGVVGVACALTNWSGGWEADSLGIPAQGVLLDYVGCSYHWDKQGIPTDMNLKKLQAVVEGNTDLI